MKALRTLPLTLRPLHGIGESFVGYTDRLAAHLDVPLAALLYRTGLIGEQRFSALPVGYGVCLSPRALGNFARVTRLPKASVSGMLLASYGGVCWDASRLDPASPDTVREAALSSWAYFVGSHACPGCIRNYGTWRLRWKLPWSFACPEHGTLLADTCPGCGRRVAAGRRDARTAPAFASLVPVPTACRNALPKGLASPGRSARPCGHDLRLIETASAAGSRVLRSQRCLDGVMASSEASVAGKPVTSLEYFRDMRSLCALLLSYGEPKDLGELPDAALRAFGLRARERSELRERRRDLVGTGGDWRSGPRSRSYVGPPESAALMAGLCTFASEALDSGSTEGLATSLEPFVERAWEMDPRGQVPQRFAYFGFSERLRETFDLCWRPRRKLTARLGMAAGPKPDIELSWLNADLVPQLFWEEEFEARLAPMLPGVLPRYARRACSMWLVKAADRCTWEESAAALGIPTKSGRAMANKVVSLLKDRGTAERFDATLREIAGREARRVSRIDYGTRRRALATFTVIGWDEWRAMCRTAGVHPGKRGGRQRQATAWLWAALTGGDHLLSPTFSDHDSESRREGYRGFVLDPLPRLKDVLEQYGERLVSAAAGSDEDPQSCRVGGGRTAGVPATR